MAVDSLPPAADSDRTAEVAAPLYVKDHPSPMPISRRVQATNEQDRSKAKIRALHTFTLLRPFVLPYGQAHESPAHRRSHFATGLGKEDKMPVQGKGPGVRAFGSSYFSFVPLIRFQTERQNVRLACRQEFSSSFSKSSKKNHCTTQ